MTRPAQSRLPLPTPRAPEPDRYVIAPFEFTGEGLGEPGPEPEDEIGRWFRDPARRWNSGGLGG